MAVAHVQTGKTIDNDGGATMTTGALTFTAGNLALLSVLSYALDATAGTVTATLGGTAMTVDKTIEATGSDTHLHLRITLLSLANVAGGSQTASISFASPNPPAATAFLTEVSGAATASYTDGTGASAGGTTQSATPATGTFTTTNSDDFWISVVNSASGSNPATITAGSGWTIPTNGSETDSSSNLTGGIEYQANPGSTSGNGQWTTDLADYVVLAFAYKAAGAGGATPDDQVARRRRFVRKRRPVRSERRIS